MSCNGFVQTVSTILFQESFTCYNLLPGTYGSCFSRVQLWCLKFAAVCPAFLFWNSCFYM